MQSVSIKRQMYNYTRLFKQSFVDYYKQEYRLFWLVQTLMIIATITGLLWIMSIVLGVSHHQNPANTEGFKYLLFFWVFEWPLWQWLLAASLLGIVSAWTSFLSIQYGVKSVLSYQKSLSIRCLDIVSNDNNQHWAGHFSQNPKQSLLRILRQGVQLNGLVARRVTRAFVSLMTFVLALGILLYMDAPLLSLLLPLSVMYFIALYYINRYTARVSTDMGDMLPVTSKRFNHLVTDVLNHKISVNNKAFEKAYQESLYMQHTRLKYLRRLSEVHVNWLNTLFLVMAIAVIIVYLVYIQSSPEIDWQQLLFFLIALRYAAGSLQEISATTVAFSRFLPEIQLLYRLINVADLKQCNEKITVKDDIIIYLPVAHYDEFADRQLHHLLAFDDNAVLYQLADLRKNGMLSSLKKFKAASHQVILIDHRMARLHRVIKKHKQHIEPVISGVMVFSYQKNNIEQLTIDEFLDYSASEYADNNEDDIDAFE